MSIPDQRPGTDLVSPICEPMRHLPESRDQCVLRSIARHQPRKTRIIRYFKRSDGTDLKYRLVDRRQERDRCRTIRLTPAVETRATIGGEHRLLENFIEYALAVADEVDRQRSSCPSQQPAEILEVLTGKETCRRHVRHHATRLDPSERQISEEAVEVCVSVKTSSIAASHAWGQLDATVRRVADHEVKGFVGRLVDQAVPDLHQDRESTTHGSADRQRHGFQEDLRHPCRYRVDFKAAHAACQRVEQRLRFPVGKFLEDPFGHGRQESTATTCRIQDRAGAPPDAGRGDLIEQTGCDGRRRVVHAEPRAQLARDRRGIRRTDEISCRDGIDLSRSTPESFGHPSRGVIQRTDVEPGESIRRGPHVDRGTLDLMPIVFDGRHSEIDREPNPGSNVKDVRRSARPTA